jgi:hypothetical protein
MKKQQYKVETIKGLDVNETKSLIKNLPKYLVITGSAKRRKNTNDLDLISLETPLDQVREYFNTKYGIISTVAKGKLVANFTISVNEKPVKINVWYSALDTLPIVKFLHDYPVYHIIFVRKELKNHGYRLTNIKLEDILTKKEVPVDKISDIYDYADIDYQEYKDPAKVEERLRKKHKIKDLTSEQLLAAEELREQRKRAIRDENRPRSEVVIKRTGGKRRRKLKKSDYEDLIEQKKDALRKKLAREKMIPKRGELKGFYEPDYGEEEIRERERVFLRNYKYPKGTETGLSNIIQKEEIQYLLPRYKKIQTPAQIEYLKKMKEREEKEEEPERKLTLKRYGLQEKDDIIKPIEKKEKMIQRTAGYLIEGAKAAYNLLGGSKSCPMAPTFIEQLTRSKKEYDVNTKDIDKAIKLISYNSNNVVQYGSFTYKAQPYPSDIDLYENILINKNINITRDDAVLDAKYILQGIVQKIMNTPGYYIGEIKLCTNPQIYDYALVSDYGQIHWGNIENNKLMDYDESKIRNDINDMLQKNLISQEQFNELINKLKPKPSLAEYFEFMEVYRNLVILRWSGDEILRGYKIVNGNQKISIEFALEECNYEEEIVGTDQYANEAELLKIDMFAPINGKYVEFSNLLVFSYKGLDNHKHLLTYGPSLDPNDLTESLKRELASYYAHLTKKYTKPIKYAKRLFVLALMAEDQPLINKLVAFFHTDINKLSHLVSEIDLIAIMFNNYDSPPKDILLNQLENIKLELSTIIEVDIDLHKIVKILDKSVNGTYTRYQITDSLVSLKEELSEIVSNGTLKYLKQNKLWPASKKYLDIDKYLSYTIV